MAEIATIEEPMSHGDDAPIGGVALTGQNMTVSEEEESVASVNFHQDICCVAILVNDFRNVISKFLHTLFRQWKSVNNLFKNMPKI